MTAARFCEQCGNALSATARFCSECGFAVTGGAVNGGAATSAAGGRAPGNTREAGVTRMLPWLIPTVAVVGVLAYAIAWSRPDGAGAPAPGMGGSGGVATDISALSADERVDRLFNRVMAAAEAGKMDSVAFFAPMAVSSFEALRPLTLHRRYDLGLIHLVSGEPALARAESDSILAVEPSHLLGLALAMRAAAATNDEAARQRFATRFLDRLSAERARDLPEYADHAGEIDAALADIQGRSGRPGAD